jgi:YggT family protein
VLGSLLVSLLELYLWGVMFPMAVLSWFPIRPGSTLASVQGVLMRLTEPVLAPVRRLVPPAGIGGMAIDLSFIIVFFAIQLVVIPLVATIF